MWLVWRQIRTSGSRQLELIDSRPVPASKTRWRLLIGLQVSLTELAHSILLERRFHSGAAKPTLTPDRFGSALPCLRPGPERGSRLHSRPPNSAGPAIAPYADVGATPLGIRRQPQPVGH